MRSSVNILGQAVFTGLGWATSWQVQALRGRLARLLPDVVAWHLLIGALAEFAAERPRFKTGLQVWTRPGLKDRLRVSRLMRHLLDALFAKHALIEGRSRIA